MMPTEREKQDAARAERARRFDPERTRRDREATDARAQLALARQRYALEECPFCRARLAGQDEPRTCESCTLTLAAATVQSARLSEIDVRRIAR